MLVTFFYRFRPSREEKPHRGEDTSRGEERWVFQPTLPYFLKILLNFLLSAGHRGLRDRRHQHHLVKTSCTMAVVMRRIVVKRGELLHAVSTPSLERRVNVFFFLLISLQTIPQHEIATAPG